MLFFAGCASNLYELPPPPEKGERADAKSAIRAEEEKAQQDYAAARAALLKAYNLLSTQRYDEAVDLMSQETRAFLTYGSDSSAADVLADGVLTLSSGEQVEFEPSTFFVAADVQKLEDSVEGVEENETDRRRELFAVSADGSAHRVIMIKQGGDWVIHKTGAGGEATTR
ncbi:MAG: hypothetical protein ACQEVA_22315 [Myxococcota bacterium]